MRFRKCTSTWGANRVWPNNVMQPTALRAAADAERKASIMNLFSDIIVFMERCNGI